MYRARVYYRGRYVASRTFPRKRDAQECDALKTGVWADPKAGEKPVRESCEIWFAAQPPRQPATERKIRGVVNEQISHAFGRPPLVSVRRSEVEGWAAGISRQAVAGDSSARAWCVAQVFEYALRDGAIHRNLAVGIKLPKVQGTDPCPLTHDQLWALVDHLPSQRDRLIVLVGGYCGVRWGELAACDGPMWISCLIGSASVVRTPGGLRAARWLRRKIIRLGRCLSLRRSRTCSLALASMAAPVNWYFPQQAALPSETETSAERP